jgi:hypothetical protein
LIIGRMDTVRQNERIQRFDLSEDDPHHASDRLVSRVKERVFVLAAQRNAWI